ncbi:MAG: right-handed parallel beta-helix repeat-containing protein [Lentimicrobiaceae bacterium]|jgi:hypothetical protein|nr:right-handed parallel beta-helix repeat-containing protein [Lentimicrobiaceae bacterium]
MKKLLLILVFACFFTTLFAQIHEVEGVQMGLWNYETVLVTGDVIIPEGEQLTIAPGTNVVFNGYYSLLVEGSLNAIGTVTDTIFFRVADSTGFAANLFGQEGSWNGLEIKQLPDSDSTLIQYCHFSNAKAVGDTLVSNGGAIYIRKSERVAIRNCRFDRNYSFYSGGAVFVDISSILIHNCVFTNNLAGSGHIDYKRGWGGGLACRYSNSTLFGLEFYDNVATGFGGGLSLEHCDVAASNCLFHDNEAYFGGAFSEMYTIKPKNSCSNFIMYNNHAGAFGGAIASLASERALYNNFTIANNYCGMGNAIFLSRESNPIFTNCIIRGNETGNALVWLWDQNAKPEFYYCNVEGETASFAGIGNLWIYENGDGEDPLFADAANFNFSLSSNSPCIDMGKPDTAGLALPSYDFVMGKRIGNNRIDLGAFEFSTAGFSDYQAKNTDISVSVFPNPLQYNSFCAIDLQQESLATVQIYSVGGKLLWQNETTRFQQGKHELSLHPFLTKKQASNTVYVLVVNTEKSKTTIKLLY